MQVYLLTQSSTRLFGGAAKQSGGYSYLHVVEKDKIGMELRCSNQLMSKLVVDRFVTLHGADRFTDRSGQVVASLTGKWKASILHNLVYGGGGGVYIFC